MLALLGDVMCGAVSGAPLLHTPGAALPSRAPGTLRGKRYAGAMVDSGAEATLTAAMSSAGASEEVLRLGSAALLVLGIKTQGGLLLERIEEGARAIPAWLDAGWEPGSGEVVGLVTAMCSAMKSLGVAVAAGTVAAASGGGGGGSSGGSVDELPAPLGARGLTPVKPAGPPPLAGLQQQLQQLQQLHTPKPPPCLSGRCRPTPPSLTSPPSLPPSWTACQTWARPGPQCWPLCGGQCLLSRALTPLQPAAPQRTGACRAPGQMCWRRGRSWLGAWAALAPALAG